MNIVGLEIENFKKLIAVSIKPDGSLVQITGRNGQGKTSTLDAIWIALGGISDGPSKPIRKGADTARIRVDLGEIVVTRKFTATEAGGYTTALTVESGEGARFPKPQALLDSLMGALSFDPLALLRMEPKDQFNEMKRFVPDVDFDAIEKANKADYDKRTDINRQIKEKKAGADLIKPSPEPAKPVDEAALVEKMRAAGEHNKDIETRKGNRERMSEKIANGKKGTDDLRRQIAEWQDLIADAEERVKNSEAQLAEMAAKLADAPPLKDPVDTAAIAAELNAARKANQDHAVWTIAQKSRADLLAEVEALTKKSEALTKAMADRQADKLAKISSAKLPIEGIGFGDGEILLNDLPFDQASGAEQLRASMAIALAANPKLPVVLIRDGSLLDEDGLRMVAEMAEARGAQVWLERVSNAGNVGVVIEAGRVKDAVPTLTAEAEVVPTRLHTDDEPGAAVETNPKEWPRLDLGKLQDLPQDIKAPHVALAESYTVVKEDAEIDGVPVDDMQEFAPGPDGHEDDGELI
jgi:hypothetical protein